MGAFKEAHGGALKELYLTERKADEEKAKAKDYPSWDLTQRQLCDLDLLMNGAFSPLDGFLGKDDYESVCDNMRLTSGVLWPLPITLDVSQEFADEISAGEIIALRDAEGVLIATLEVSDLWVPDLMSEKPSVSTVRTTTLTRPLRTSSTRHTRSMSEAQFAVSSRRLTLTSNCCVTRHRSCVGDSASWAGARLLRSRHVTRCTRHTRSSHFARHGSRMRTS
jgi:ATP sulfurylase